MCLSSSENPHLKAEWKADHDTGEEDAMNSKNMDSSTYFQTISSGRHSYWCTEVSDKNSWWTNESRTRGQSTTPDFFHFHTAGYWLMALLLCISPMTIIYQFLPIYTNSYRHMPLIMLMLCAIYKQLMTTISVAFQHENSMSFLCHWHIPLLTSSWWFFIAICHCWLLCKCCSTCWYPTGICLHFINLTLEPQPAPWKSWKRQKLNHDPKVSKCRGCVNYPAVKCLKKH